MHFLAFAGRGFGGKNLSCCEGLQEAWELGYIQLWDIVNWLMFKVEKFNGSGSINVSETVKYLPAKDRVAFIFRDK